jgi:transposase
MAESNKGRSMVAPLSDCTIKEQRTVVRFLWAEGVKYAAVHRRMLTQYGAHTMHQRKIYEWIERFKDGRTSVTDESRPGHPSTSQTDQHIQRVDVLMIEDRWLTSARVAQVHLAWWRPASGADVALWATESFFFEGMKKLVEQYRKCIFVQGDYVEK